MSQPQLWKVTYEDRKGGTRLDCYADTIVYNPARGKGPQPAAIRFGGEPEKVRGLRAPFMAAALWRWSRA